MRGTTRTRAGLVGAAALLALCGCEGGDPDGSAGAGLPQQTSVTAPVEEGPLPCVAGVETVPGVGGLTPEQTMAAYCHVADAVRQVGFTDAVRPGAVSARELREVLPLLTPEARDAWEADVTAWSAQRDRGAGERLDALVLHDVTEVPAGYVLDAPWVHGTEVGAPTPREVPGGLELGVTSTSGVVLARRGEKGGRHSVLPVTRDATYVLVPHEGGWLIDDWSAEISFGEPRLVTG